MECECSNCFECPYPDCIITEKQLTRILSIEKRAAREGLGPDQYNKYYAKNREKRKAYQRERYRLKKLRQEAMLNGAEKK